MVRFGIFITFFIGSFFNFVEVDFTCNHGEVFGIYENNHMENDGCFLHLCIMKIYWVISKFVVVMGVPSAKYVA